MCGGVDLCVLGMEECVECVDRPEGKKQTQPFGKRRKQQGAPCGAGSPIHNATHSRERDKHDLCRPSIPLPELSLHNRQGETEQDNKICADIPVEEVSCGGSTKNG